MGIDVQAFEKDLDRFDEAMRADIVDARFQLGEKALHKLKEKSPVKTGNYVYNHPVSSGAV